MLLLFFFLFDCCMLGSDYCDYMYARVPTRVGGAQRVQLCLIA